MSLRLEMLQVARLAPKILGESAELVKRFLLSQQNQDGGFKDRTGGSDLYYTVFGLDSLFCLDGANAHSENPRSSIFSEAIERAARFVDDFENGCGLDFVHLCCLARCWAVLADHSNPWGREKERGELLGRIEALRSRDGGYHAAPQSATGTAYGCFLALGAYQDLNAELPDPLRLVQCLKCLETRDGAWTNERVSSSPNPAGIGSTNATAAAVTALRLLRQPIHAPVGDWLLARVHPQGGFVAAPGAPIPDLLSTATALHALAGLEKSFEPIQEKTLDFVDSLWTNQGGFYGTWADDTLDCEYAFYGLLALGHLSF